MKKWRVLLPTAGAIALVAPLAAIAATNSTVVDRTPVAESSTEFVNALATTCYTSPDAAAIPVSGTDYRNRMVSGLHYDNGRVYYIYGHWAANTGVNVSYFDTSTHTFVVPIGKVDSAHNFSEVKNLDGDLYTVPGYTAHSGRPQRYATNASGTWSFTRGKGVLADQINDVAKVGGALFMVGARPRGAPTTIGTKSFYPGAAATLWKSEDGGDTWVEDYRVADPDETARSGAAHFGWVGRIKDTLYVHASSAGATQLTARDPDTGAWEPVAGSAAKALVATRRNEEVLDWKNRIWQINVNASSTSPTLKWFDGVNHGEIPLTTGNMDRATVSISATEEGLLVLLDNGEIHRVVATETETGDYTFNYDSSYWAYAPLSKAATVGGGYLWTTGTLGLGKFSDICATPLTALVDSTTMTAK